MTKLLKVLKVVPLVVSLVCETALKVIDYIKKEEK